MSKASSEIDDDGDDLVVPAKKSRARSSGGRRPPPAHLPTVVESHKVCACGLCGAGVLQRDVIVGRMYTIVPEHVRCREIRRDRVVCTNPSCNKPTTALMPPMPCERALYDCNFIAWLVVMKFVLLVPLDRIRLLLRSQGVDLAMGTLVHLIERAASLADAVDGEHMKQLRRGGWMSFDGTGLKTLIVGQDKAWDGYLEVFVRDEITVFQFDLTKHADALKARIGEFTGILVCDAESRNAAGAANATFANCNAHAVRKFEDAERVQPKLAAQARRFLRALYDLEDEAKNAGLTEDRLVAFRQRRSRRVLKRFRQWLKGVLRRPLPPSDPVVKVASFAAHVRRPAGRPSPLLRCGGRMHRVATVLLALAAGGEAMAHESCLGGVTYPADHAVGVPPDIGILRVVNRERCKNEEAELPVNGERVGDLGFSDSSWGFDLPRLAKNSVIEVREIGKTIKFETGEEFGGSFLLSEPVVLDAGWQELESGAVAYSLSLDVDVSAWGVMELINVDPSPPDVVRWWPVEGMGEKGFTWVDHERSGDCMLFALDVVATGAPLETICPEGLGCSTAGRGPMSVAGLALLLTLLRRRRRVEAAG